MEEEAAAPNVLAQEEEEMNIGTILQYLVDDCLPAVNPTNVVLGPDVISGLGEHINLGNNNYSCPSTSEGWAPSLYTYGIKGVPQRGT